MHHQTSMSSGSWKQLESRERINSDNDDANPNKGGSVKRNDSNSNNNTGQRGRSNRKAAQEAKDKIFGETWTDECDN